VRGDLTRLVVDNALEVELAAGQLSRRPAQGRGTCPRAPGGQLRKGFPSWEEGASVRRSGRGRHDRALRSFLTAMRILAALMGDTGSARSRRSLIDPGDQIGRPFRGRRTQRSVLAPLGAAVRPRSRQQDRHGANPARAAQQRHDSGPCRRAGRAGRLYAFVQHSRTTLVAPAPVYKKPRYDPVKVFATVWGGGGDDLQQPQMMASIPQVPAKKGTVEETCLCE